MTSTCSSVHPYLGRGDGHLDLTLGGGHDLVELVADALEEAESVVLGEGFEEVLDGGTAAAGLLDKLGNNGGLVLGAQGRGSENVVELGVLVGNGTEGSKGLGGRVESRRLGGSSVLKGNNWTHVSDRELSFPTSFIVFRAGMSFEVAERYKRVFD